MRQRQTAHPTLRFLLDKKRKGSSRLVSLFLFFYIPQFFAPVRLLFLVFGADGIKWGVFNFYLSALNFMLHLLGEVVLFFKSRFIFLQYYLNALMATEYSQWRVSGLR